MTILRSFLLFCFIALTGFATPAAHAASDKGAKIAVVNIQELIRESIAAQDVQKQLEKQRTQYQKELSEKEKKLRDQEKDILSKRSTMSQDEFVSERKKFEAAFQDAQKTAAERRRTLINAENEGLGKINNEIIRIVAQIADKQGYDAVLTRQNIVIVSKSIDITEQVKSELNQSLKSVPLQIK